MCKRLMVAFALAMPAYAFGSASGQAALDIGEAFPAQHAKIQATLADGKTYSEISRQDAEAVKQALDRIAGHLQQAGTLQALDAATQSSLLGDQELVNRLLSKAGENSRQICVRERKLGSNRITSHCTTVAERRRQTEAARNSLQDAQRTQAPAAN